MDHGHESYIAYGRGDRPSKSELIRIGSQKDLLIHGLKTALLDRHGFGSRRATEQFVSEIERIQPDVIGMHNIHGYYLHVGVLFRYLKQVGVPVIWTFHDCWPFTGHCSFYGAVNRDTTDCMKWAEHCRNCPKQKKYPASYLLDQSARNFTDKQKLFTAVPQLTIVTPSHWLADKVGRSFLKEQRIEVIHNGVDLDNFKPVEASGIREKYRISGKKIVLGVASIWDERKGLKEFIALSRILPDDYQIVLVGLSEQQISQLPEYIRGVPRTESLEELAALYTLADVFANPTFLDNFPNTNIEALACGTPIVTYATGGSPEAVDEVTGRIVGVGAVEDMARAITQLTDGPREAYRQQCRQRAEMKFNKYDRYKDYLALYETMISSALNPRY